jgi:hypothetical protein
MFFVCTLYLPSKIDGFQNQHMLDCTIKDVDPIGNTLWKSNVTIGNPFFLKKTSINEPMDNMFFSLNGKINLGH